LGIPFLIGSKKFISFLSADLEVYTEIFFVSYCTKSRLEFSCFESSYNSCSSGMSSGATKFFLDFLIFVFLSGESSNDEFSISLSLSGSNFFMAYVSCNFYSDFVCLTLDFVSISLSSGIDWFLGDILCDFSSDFINLIFGKAFTFVSYTGFKFV